MYTLFLCSFLLPKELLHLREKQPKCWGIEDSPQYLLSSVLKIKRSKEIKRIQIGFLGLLDNKKILTTSQWTCLSTFPSKE